MATLTGDNGLLQKATTAKEANEQAKELELIKLAVSAAQVSGEGTITKDNLENELKINFNDNTITIGEIEDGWSYNSYKIDKSGEVDKLLPKEYQQVEYIESSGQQWIDTGYKASNQTKIALTFSTTKTYTETSIIGARSDYRLNAMDFTLHRGGWYVYGNKESELPIDFENNAKYSVIIDNNKLQYKLSSNDIFTNIMSFEPQIFTTDYTLFIFAENWKGNSGFKSSVSIYNLAIFESTKLIRNFIPCYSTTNLANVDGVQIPTNTKGLYDTVEGKFYTNQGTGTFGYGMEDGTYIAPTNN